MAQDSSVLSDDYVGRLNELMQSVQAGDEENAAQLLDELTKLRENSLFQELGKLTREFHEALNTFRLDSRIANLAEQEFPDARERLKYVVNMTAQAADRSLTAVENSMPVCDRIHNEGQELSDEWQRFLRREMSADEFRLLSGRISEFLGRAGADAAGVKENLNEITMAQDFQDLTGQVIGRVITLVDDMESSLVDLIRISGQNLMQKKNKPEPREEKDHLEGTGPMVPGVDDASSVVSGQDEVDDLLSSLGF